MTTEREMTLHEWVGKLPEIHLARREFVAMQERIAELEQEVIDIRQIAHLGRNNLLKLKAVAEAAVKLMPMCQLVADEEIELNDALRAAGYLI